MLFHKSLLAKAIPFPAVGFYDQWLALNAAAMGQIENTKEVLVRYRQHANNQTDLEGKRRRITGFQRAKMRISRENIWLIACKPIFQNQKAECFPKIIDLANSRENSYFSFGFGLEIWRNRNLYLSITSKGFFSDLAFASRYSWGLKLKKLFHV
ncbi:hypothetical protein MM236_18855 [Belliella sp. DSM 107340]|uniref:Uncharacterized protein n=1 Tax=Belliella calami TaxID=2923436 RepID=A0ABS9UTV6_9BACT|nr:hypothetical protein [Belliella calami]MCH7400062.1 hypothetical protein [Belliella calami]